MEVALLLLIALIMVVTLSECREGVSTEASVTQSYDSEARDAHSATTVTTHNAGAGATQVFVDKSEPEEEPAKEDLYVHSYTEQDVIDIAKVLYHECRGVPSKTEQACVAWTVLNRVDRNDSTIYSIIRAPYQFAFYESAPVWDELLDLARDVLDRWSREKAGETNVGRVLPKEYTYFEGRDGHNYFRDNYSGSYNIWDYSLDSPYEN